MSNNYYDEMEIGNSGWVPTKTVDTKIFTTTTLSMPTVESLMKMAI